MGNDRLLIAFYGDDFTGSTDALEALNNCGIKTVLFIDVPTPDQLRTYPNLQAIGIAGMSRTMSPAEMEVALIPAFESLAKLNPKHVHYKVCSTFDSSSKIGSIGKAIDLASSVFKTSMVSLLVASPNLGRYCLFGNLFARMGIGSEGNIYRLDRHPAMCSHPTTPADESDLRLHLAKQTQKRIGLFDILAIRQFRQSPFKIDHADYEIMLFDALEQEDLSSIGQIIATHSNDDIIFSVGSSGIEMALGAYWKNDKLTTETQKFNKTSVGKAILVASGSCSVVTTDQIQVAMQHGFAEIAIDTEALAGLADPGFDANASFIDATAKYYAAQINLLLADEKNVIVHTSLGNDDSRVQSTDLIFGQKGLDKSTTAKLYGSLLGKIIKMVAAQSALRRVVVAGGDTSSYAARAMGIESVEMIATLTPGAPICVANAPGSPVDKLEVVFKGGQVGKSDFFIQSSKDIVSDN